MKIDVKSCQRCGTNHDQLEFKPLQNAADDYDWWAMCPSSNEPVLLRIVNDGESKSKLMEKTIHVGQGTKLVIIETKELPRGSIVIEGARPI